MKKKSASNFDKFAKKKSNAAIKEQFRQEKKKFKKEREEYFDKKRAESRQQSSQDNKQSQTGRQPTAPSHPKPVTAETMPLNKFIAHSGLCARREAAEMVKKGLVKVNNELVMEPGHKVSAKDEVKVN